MRTDLALFRDNRGRPSRWVALLALMAVVPLAAGCYGRFPLTKAVYKFNSSLSNDDLVRSVAMWGLVVVPVYGVATLGDVLVIHLIEFWSGERVDVAATTIEDGTKVALEPSADGRQVVLTVSRDGRLLSQTAFVKTSDTEFDVRDTGSRLVGRVVRTSGGDLRLTDAHGATVRTLSARDIAAISGG